MAEIYSFTAKVVARLKYRIRICPDDRDAFMDYLERAGLSPVPYLRERGCFITIGNRKMIDALNGAARVRYSVEKRYNRMWGIKMEPLP